MAPIKSSLAKSAKQLLGLRNTDDLGLRGAAQKSRRATPKISATGGNSTFTYSGKKIHKFTSPGSLAIASGGGNIEYVVVAGGGGGGKGGNNRGGGAGAGGYRTGTISHPEGPLTVPVTVGDGGISENNGNPSVFNHPASPITSTGGGRGGNEAEQNAGNGGSGGGAGGVTSGGSELNAGSASPPGQGNPGAVGWAVTGQEATGGGGGGAGSAADNINGVDARAHGGRGLQLPATFRDPNNVTGAPGPGGENFWVAGGGGAAAGTAPGVGGGGGTTTGWAGGGPGGSPGAANGTANTGGGGGGGASAGGAGGSGVVLVAYDA